ncbi:hypothetical protein V8C37DRAFT_413975 [Trichoderma ceciliae]
MGLVKRSYRVFSDIFQAPLDSGGIAASPRASGSILKERVLKARALVAERAVRFINVRGKKRKRRGDNGDFDRRKRRLVKGGVVAAVGEKEEDEEEEESVTIRDDVDGVVRCTDTSRLPSSPSKFPATDVAYSQESHEQRIAKVSINLEKLTFTESDTPSIDSSPSTPHTETHDDYDWSWLERNQEHCIRRCCSDGSIRLPVDADAFAGALPDGRGRRSAPPTLDATWSLTSHLADCLSTGSVSALTREESPDEVAESLLNISLEANSESESKSETEVEGKVEAPEPEPVKVKVKAEVEEEAKVKAEVKVLTEAVALAIVEAGVLGESQAEDEPEAASTTTESASELTFRLGDLPAKRLDKIEHVQLCFREREAKANAEQLAGRIRGLRKAMMDRLEGIEQALQPHCRGSGWG